MKQNDKIERTFRCAMLLPLVLMVASVVTGLMSYGQARQEIADDLNEAMISLVRERGELLTRQDTVVALRQMRFATNSPMICQATDLGFRNRELSESAYFTLALVDGAADGLKNGSVVRQSVPAMTGRIASDSIMLVSGCGTDSAVVRLQGFADCSLASVLSSSDQTLPGCLFALALLSATSLMFRRRRQEELQPEIAAAVPSIEDIRLTPMQRRLTQMLLDAPRRRVGKESLCKALWGNKGNAEESLYTLVRRTKNALADAGMEIVCNRGESYELRLKD